MECVKKKWSIFRWDKTSVLLSRSLSFFYNLGVRGIGNLLFVEPQVLRLFERRLAYLNRAVFNSDIFSLVFRWIPGMFTNFTTTRRKLVRALRRGLKRQGRYFSYLPPSVLPTISVIGDPFKSYGAIVESNTYTIPVMSLVPANLHFGHSFITYPIPANSVSLLTRLLFYRLLILNWLRGFAGMKSRINLKLGIGQRFVLKGPRRLMV